MPYPLPRAVAFGARGGGGGWCADVTGSGATAKVKDAPVPHLQQQNECAESERNIFCQAPKMLFL